MDIIMARASPKTAGLLCGRGKRGMMLNQQSQLCVLSWAQSRSRSGKRGKKISRAKWYPPFLAVLCFPAFASGATITFDDLPGNTGTIPNGYGGFNWSYFYYLDSTNPFGDNEPNGFTNGTVSPSRVAYNNSLGIATVSGPSFMFSSAFFTAAWRNELEITVSGYLNGTQVGQSIFLVNSNYPSRDVFDFGPVDQVTFVSSGGVDAGLNGSSSQFVMDNMTVSFLPESTCLGLFCAGLGLIALARRSRRDLKPVSR